MTAHNEFFQYEMAFHEYLEKMNFTTVKKDHYQYIVFEGVQIPFVYVVKEGIVKTSLLTKDGREFNIGYIQKNELVSLVGNEHSNHVDMPFNIRVESDTAELYQINRVQFWEDVNNNENLLKFVKEYYRQNLVEQIKKSQNLAMNGKFGALCAQIYDLAELFGCKSKEGILIDFNITNEELAKFCGINSASSINRMLRKLKDMDSIKIVNNKILIKDLSIIESFVA